MIKRVNYEDLKEVESEWVDNQIANISNGMIFWRFLVLIMILMPLALLLIRPDGESMATWFQRSGSLIVVIALLAEINVNHLHRLAVSQNYSFLNCNKYLTYRYKKKIQVINAVTILFVLLGTIVWGYGDLIWNYFTSILATSNK